jgi:hypothetical protein
MELPPTCKYYGTGSYFYDAGREAPVRAAMKTDDPEWIFFLDSDVIPPFNAIPRLIQIAKENNISVLSGLCWLKRACEPAGTLEEAHIPRPNAFFKISEDLDNELVNYTALGDEIKPFLDKNAIIEVDAVGCACLLIKTEIFKKLDKSNPNKPFFQFGHYRKDENTGKPLLKLGEDAYFCYRLTSELGIRPHLSTEIKCEHVFFPGPIVSRRGSDGKLMI